MQPVPLLVASARVKRRRLVGPEDAKEDGDGCFGDGGDLAAEESDDSNLPIRVHKVATSISSAPTTESCFGEHLRREDEKIQGSVKSGEELSGGKNSVARGAGSQIARLVARRKKASARAATGCESDDVEAFRADLAACADGGDVKEYADVPVSQFAKRMLKGMGWKGEIEGEKPAQTKPPKPRPARLGLGAKPKTEKEEGAKLQRNQDGSDAMNGEDALENKRRSVDETQNSPKHRTKGDVKLRKGVDDRINTPRLETARSGAEDDGRGRNDVSRERSSGGGRSREPRFDKRELDEERELENRVQRKRSRAEVERSDHEKRGRYHEYYAERDRSSRGDRRYREEREGREPANGRVYWKGESDRRERKSRDGRDRNWERNWERSRDRERHRDSGRDRYASDDRSRYRHSPDRYRRRSRSRSPRR